MRGANIIIIVIYNTAVVYVNWLFRIANGRMHANTIRYTLPEIDNEHKYIVINDNDDLPIRFHLVELLIGIYNDNAGAKDNRARGCFDIVQFNRSTSGSE